MTSNIKNYSTTQASNISLNGIDTNEGMLPSNLNNALRALMKNTRDLANDSQWFEIGVGSGTYTSAWVSTTQFTIASSVDISATYHVGRRLKVLKGDNSLVYGSITATSNNGTLQTVTATFDSGNLGSSSNALRIYIGALSKTNSSIPTEIIGTANIANNAVTTAKILDNNVTVAKMADNSVDSDQYVDSSIDTAHIANSQITVDKMAANSVDSDQYVDGSVDLIHLSADSVNGSKIADDSINSEHYVDASIDSQHIADSQITLAKMASNSVNSAKIVDDSIVNADINSSAAISLSKLENLTTARALVSDGSGDVSVSAVTSTEIGHLDGVTSAIQTQINSKQQTITGSATTIDTESLTANRAVISNGSQKIAVSDVTSTELGYLDGVSSAIQTQLNSKQQTITGAATTIDTENLTASRALTSNGSGKVEVSDVTSTELGFLDGVSSSIQTQINGLQTNNANLTAIGNLARTDGNLIVGNGSTWVAENGSTARTSLGLGSVATQAANNVSISGGSVTGLGEPSNNADAATKSYVDQSVAGLRTRLIAECASTANVNISNGLEAGDTIDGITLVAGDRILLKNQSTATENGLYIAVANGAGAASRDPEHDTIAELSGGMIVVNQGSVNDNKIFLCTTDSNGSIGSTAITYTVITPSNSGTVTSIATGTGINGGTITSTGTLSIDSTVATLSGTQTLTNKTLNSPKVNENVAVTSTATELNILDGVTSTTAELNILDGVTSTTAELNILDGATVVVGEINALDLGSTAIGTAIASKAVILDSNKDYTGLRNVTLSGELDAGSLDVSGNADIDGTLETDALSINGTTVTSTATELNKLDAVSRGSLIYGNPSAATAILTKGGAGTVLTSDGTDIAWQSSAAAAITSTANGANNRIATYTGAAGLNGEANLTFDGSTFVTAGLTITSDPKLSATGSGSNIDLDLLAKGTGHVTIRGNSNDGTLQLNCTANTHGQQIKAQPHSTSTTNIMLLPQGADSTLVSLVSTDTLTNKTLTSPKINENVAVTSTATELNILDGVTSTTAELNILDGVTSTAAELNLLDGKDATFLAVPGKKGGTNFTDSLLVGHSTTGTLNASERNTGVGTTALNALTSGDRNTAVGYNALTGETSGQFNTAVGSSALASQVAATYNVGIGYQTGVLLSSSDFNTLVGAQAGDSLTGGDCNYNLLLGYQSGENLTSGAGNVIIGSVDAGSATGNRQLMISGYDGSTTTNWISGDSSGNLTIAGTVTANGQALATAGDATSLAIALG